MTTILYIFIVFCLIISIGAMRLTDRLCEKYSKYRNGLHLTGREIVDCFVKDNNLEKIEITCNGGDDYFDQNTENINLSDMTYNKDTVTAMSITAHECGHMLQAKGDFALLKIRKAFMYYVNAGVYIGAVAISVGYVLKIPVLMDIATVLMAIALMFQFFTLPIETDASSKALKYLETKNIDGEELDAVKRLLFVASISYFGNLFYNVINMFKTSWSIKKRVIDFDTI